jgi:hypothetical protein
MTSDDDIELRFAERFRQSHHAIATYVAMGWSDSKISQVTGKSRRNLTILRNTPLFRELVEQKRRIAEEQGLKATEEQMKAEFELRTLMTKNAILAESFVHEKLEAADISGELPPFRDLNMITSDRLDRLGYSKHTITHHTSDFGALLDRAIVRSGRQAQLSANGDVIDGEVLRLPDFSLEPAVKESLSPASTPQAKAQERKVSSAPPAAPGPSIAAALRRRFA